MKKKNFEIKTMKKLALIIAFFSLVGYAYAQYDERALTVLNAMSSKYQSYSSFTAEFNYSMENEQEDIKDEFNGTITIMGEKYRLDMGIQEIFNNGETIWTYMPEEKEVNITEFDPDEEELTPSKIITAYESGYKYILLDNESDAEYNVIDLIPENSDEQFFKVRMSISKKDNLIKSWKIFDKNGNNYVHTITKFSPNDSMKSNYFEFDASKYPGVEVVDLR